MRNPGGARARDLETKATCWSVIVRAQGSGPEARAALDTLIRRYEKTVELIIRSYWTPWNLSTEELKQEFFLRFLRSEDVLKLDKERGRFRNWLHVAVKRFMWNTRASWFAERHGNTVTSPADFHVAQSETPERILMRQFAEETLVRAIERHRAAAPNKEKFDRLLRFLPGPAVDLDALAPIAEQLGTTSNALAVRINELRARHKRILREHVADTLDVDPNDPDGARCIDIEMKELLALLREPIAQTVTLVTP